MGYSLRQRGEWCTNNLKHIGMKRKLLFLFCLVLAVPLIPVAAQQTATVKGIVTDAQTGEPLKEEIFSAKLISVFPYFS